MSETILRVLLGELQTLRIVCKQCRNAVEVSVAAFDRQPQHARRPQDVCCPGCGARIRAGVSPGQPPPQDAFDQLVKAWQSLDTLSGTFDIQFIIQEPAKKASDLQSKA